MSEDLAAKCFEGSEGKDRADMLRVALTVMHYQTIEELHVDYSCAVILCARKIVMKVCSTKLRGTVHILQDRINHVPVVSTNFLTFTPYLQ